MKKITFLLVALISMSFFGQEALNTADHQFLSEGVWKTVHRDVYTYDAAGNLISDSFLRRNDADTGWENMELFIHTYDSNNKLTEKLLKVWDTNLSEPAYVENVKTIYTYNTNNKLVEYMMYFMVNGVWENDMKVTSTFNSEGNKIEEVSYFWSGTAWTPANRDVIELDTNNRPSIIYIEGWTGSVWHRNNNKEITYNENGKVILEIYKQLEEGVFVAYSKTEFEYDVNGNLLSKKVYNVENNVFVFGYDEVFTVDTNYLLSSFYHPFEDSTGLEYGVSGIPWIHKVLGISYGSSSKITYTYGEATAGVENNEVISLKAYPNPTNSIVTMEASELEKVDVYNILGKKLFSANDKQIDLTNFSNGVYLFKVYTNDGRVANRKIIKN